MERISTLLRRFSLLEALPEERLQMLSERMQHRRLERGTTVMRRGDASSALYFVMDGRLKVVDHTPGGREIGLAWLGAGDWFGEMALIDEQPRAATVVTVTESVLLSLDGAAAREHLLADPSVVQHLLRYLAGMVRRDNHQRTLLSSGTAFERVCRFLLSIAPPDSACEPWTIEPTLTQDAIASMTDTSRETVSRALALLRERGVVEKREQRIVIVDPPGLERMVQGVAPEAGAVSKAAQ